MNEEIRILKMRDYDSIKNLFEFTDLIDKGFKNFYLNEIDNYKSFGIFIDDQLVEFISIIENKEIPAWSISKSCSKYKNFFQDLISYIIAYEEQNKRYQFFLLTNKRKTPSIDNRYNCYLEHVVPKNTLTGYENIDHDVLEYQTYDDTMFIYLSVLKNEYRSF